MLLALFLALLGQCVVSVSFGLITGGPLILIALLSAPFSAVIVSFPLSA